MNGNVIRPIRAFMVLVLIVAGLWILDWSLERTELSELHSEAQRAYLAGSQLFEQGKTEPAIEQLRRAHTLERQNSVFELGLIDALMAAGKTADAGTLLDEMLARESNDGRVNLTAARWMAITGRISDADSYYHRAIYGKWSSPADVSRRAARMELVAFLVKQGRKQELLAELLPVQAEAGNDPVLKKRIAGLLLVAGSASRAADDYRSLIEQNRADADLYSGLGEAELLQGRYRTAVGAFVAAFHRRPNDPSVRRRMEFAGMMSGLDPTPRQLASMEKYQRSLRVLDLARAAYRRCTGQPPTADSGLPSIPPRHVTNELAEQQLAAAKQLWRARIGVCGAGTSTEEEPLKLIMAKLTQ